jgi:hypothetical protein
MNFEFFLIIPPKFFGKTSKSEDVVVTVGVGVGVGVRETVGVGVGVGVRETVGVGVGVGVGVEVGVGVRETVGVGVGAAIEKLPNGTKSVYRVARSVACAFTEYVPAPNLASIA